jgi:hypothetical protein
MMNMSKCAQPGCSSGARSSYSRCVREQNCGSRCQKSNWKAHSSMCPILKKLTRKLQPYREVARLIDDVLESKRGNDCRVLEHSLSFAEHQFGKGVTGKYYREREDGTRISNWIVDLEILHKVIQTFASLHGQNNLLSTIVQDDMSFPYLERLLSLLNPWMINVDLDAREGINNLSEDQKKICWENCTIRNSTWQL